MSSLTKALILGAGREPPDDSGRIPLPRCLLTDPFGTRVMDWILAALKAVEITDTTFVGGYRIEDVGAQYPDLKYIYNPEWESSGVLDSFYHARKELTGPLLVSYADIVYSPAACRTLIEGDPAGITIAIDRAWKSRAEALRRPDGLCKNLVVEDGGLVRDIGFLPSETDASGEFIGLAYLGSEAIPVLRRFLDLEYPKRMGQPFQQARDIRKGFLTDLLRYLMQAGIEVRAADIGTDWAEMEDTARFARFVLTTKSQTLDRLGYLVGGGRFCEQLTLTVDQWRDNSADILRRVAETFSGRRVVVRSSALVEDSWTASHAGAFESVLDVNPDSANDVKRAVSRVITSYGRIVDGEDGRNQILIQEQVRQVASSGVVFTRDIETGAPYYVINYDDESRSTESVTHGVDPGLKTSVVSRSHIEAVQSPDLRKLLQVVLEIEAATGCKALDIEFAVSVSGDIYVLQVRPLATDVGIDHFSEIRIERELTRIRDFVASMFQPVAGLYGDTTILADMPDWNPAEMIGIHPRPLAMSLYNHLIMEKAWRIARAKIGYHDPGPMSLMVGAGGHPYVDVRCSFNNLLPAGLPEGLAAKLVNHYLDELRRDPSKHDKIEFEVCFTCLDFDFVHQAERLRRNGFLDAEVDSLRHALMGLTDRIVSGSVCSFEELQSSYEMLGERTRDAVRGVTSPHGRLRAVTRLLDECITLGTVPFSILARYGFIANSLMRSLVARGVLDEDRKFAFLKSVETVASTMVSDMNRVISGTMPIAEFLEIYGHLRPGTYEITSLRYDEAADVFFNFDGDKGANASVSAEDGGHVAAFEWTAEELQSMARLIGECGFSFSVDTMLLFIRRAVAMRELGKFEFTRTLSEILLQLTRFGEEHGMTREDLSFISIQSFRKWAWMVEPYDFKDQLQKEVQAGRDAFRCSRLIKLPHMVMTEGDLFAFDVPPSRANFVTTKQVVAAPVSMSEDLEPHDLQSRIVFIEGADPGYDWIFAHGIAGLVTKYGGAASHMTIRAAEFGIPAAIGCGEGLFEGLRDAKLIELNCAARQIHAV